MTTVPFTVLTANNRNPIYQSIHCVCAFVCAQLYVFPTCVWWAVVVVVLLCCRLQVVQIFSHQLQFADLGPSVLDSLWHLQHMHTVHQHSVVQTCSEQVFPEGIKPQSQLWKCLTMHSSSQQILMETWNIYSVYKDYHLTAFFQFKSHLVIIIH